MTMDVHPSRTAGIRLHRVAAEKIEPIRGDRARTAGARPD
ncbi:MAG: diguanylate cyclase/phosphodiesterase (GGDEF & EAL domains) with PAS/PAC sensor(s) [Rhodanobacteraceae bacterium]|nr:MAG: diguanylate cyclase/phosphodiesterase (GGDEF & EAL domains) with PAS/PAC sensor(s) [Rhodanobacteraceae bacterium]